MKKLYFYDEEGDLQEIPNYRTVIASEKELDLYRNQNYNDFPVNVGLSKPLTVGETVNLLLEEDFEMKGSHVLLYKENPVTTDYDDGLKTNCENPLFDILKNWDDTVGVIKHESSIIWFNPDHAAYIEDMELEEKSESSNSGGTIIFLIFILALLGIIISKCS
jgi:hypothetical protein